MTLGQPTWWCRGPLDEILYLLWGRRLNIIDGWNNHIRPRGPTDGVS